MARPKIPLDEEKIFKLARRQWTPEEIGSFFGVHADTIRRRYADLLEEAKHAGKAKLKERLWTEAFKKKRSDKIFLHAVNRFVGPIPKDIRLDLSKIPDAELVEHVAERIGVNLVAGTPEALSDVRDEEGAEKAPSHHARPPVHKAKQLRRESSALSGSPNVPTRRKK